MGKIKIPATTKSFYDFEEIPQNKVKIKDIENKYGQFIRNASKNSNVDERLIKAFIFIESGGNPNVISSADAVGLMQLKPESASDILVTENRKKRLNENEKAVIRKFLGDRFDKGILKMKFLGDKVNVNGKKSAVWITTDDLLKPELNIALGTIYLGLLLDEHKVNNVIELHKVVGRYNMGYFSKKGLTAPTLESYVAKVPKETKDYVYKLVGTNGILTIV